MSLTSANTSFKLLNALVAALFALLPAARSAPASTSARIDHQALQPMVSITFNTLHRVNQSFSLALQGIALPSTAAAFQEQLRALILLPDTSGIDTYAPSELHLLAPDPPTTVPIVAALLPLSDSHGATLIASLQQHYETVTHQGGIITCSAPRNPAHEPLLLLAVAEKRALVATHHAAIRWLALQLRDRKLPTTLPLSEPLRICANGPHLGTFVQLYASLVRDTNPAAAPLLLSLARHLYQIGELLSACETVNLGIAGSIRDFSATLQLYPATDSPLATTLAALPPPSAELDRRLPDERLTDHIGTLLPLLQHLPAETIPWLDELAATTQIAGLRAAPGIPDSLKLILPHASGHYAATLSHMPRGHGLCHLQLFQFPDHQSACSAFEALQTALQATLLATAKLQPLPSRKSGALQIVGYQLAQATNQLSLTGYGSAMANAFAHQLHLNTVEFTCHQEYLAIARAPAGTIEELLSPPPDKRPPTTLQRNQSSFAPLPTDATLLAAGELAPTDALRYAIASLPALADQLTKLPLPGDALHWRAWRQSAHLTWQLRLPGNEVVAWHRLTRLDNTLIQEFLANFTLEQLNRATGKPKLVSPQQQQETPDS